MASSSVPSRFRHASLRRMGCGGLFSRLLSSWTTVLALILLVGCSGSGATATYPVQGTVTYQRKPVSHGMVVFRPATGKLQTAPIGADGRYQLKVPEGTYQVAVVAPAELPDVPAGISDPLKRDVAVQYRQAKPSVPSRFGRPETSGITVEVEPSDENTIDVPLL